MRILLDECIDERLRHSFPGHECQTARFVKLAGLSNGDLLSAAETLGFNVIVTIDQNIQFQQNFEDRMIAVLILCASTSRLQELESLIPTALAALASIQPGTIAKIAKV